MTMQLIVPNDGSPVSWTAFEVALGLAERLDVGVCLLEIAADPVDGRFAAQRLHEEMSERGPFDVEVEIDVRLQVETVADEIARAAASRPGAVLVMASHGRGRSAEVLGSVADATVRRTTGPILLVGPQVETPFRFDGPVLATVDGSDASETALPVAATWAFALGCTPWLLHVGRPGDDAARTRACTTGSDGDILESGHLAGLAHDLSVATDSEVQFEELHGRHPVPTVSEHARRVGASLVVASSHGRSGVSRLALGSVAAGFVHECPCPVMVVRQSTTTSTGPLRRPSRPIRR